MRAARRFSGGIAKDLLCAGVACSEESGGEEMSLGGEGIAVGLLDLADQAVGTKQADLASDLGGESSAGFRGRVGTHGVQ